MASPSTPGSSSRPGERGLGARLGRPFRTYFGVFRDPSISGPAKALHAAGGLAIVFALVVLAVVVYAAVLIPLTPSPSELRRQTSAQPTVVLAADGTKLAQYERLNREWVPLSEVSPAFLDALLATEDRRFYEHGGVDWQRVVGAGFKTLTGDLQGGSTLTQQLARNLYPDEIGRELSIGRKLRELVTAYKIERSHAKEEILEAYVNTVPFLYNAFGVEMAARTYFGTNAGDLTALQAATLVGMLKGTSYYNPVRNPERARERRNVVLQQMVKAGKLDAAEYDGLAAEPLELDFERQEGPQSLAPHFTRYVRDWLTEWADRYNYDLFADGLVVHTTLSWELQQMAERAVRETGEGLQAVADVEWSRASMPRVGGGLGSYVSYRGRVTPFAHWWQTNPRAVERYVRATEEFKRGREAGLSEAALLDSLRADAAFMDSLRTLRTRLEVGLAAIEPQTGHVKAWVGSRDFGVTAYDQVYQARRQAGSTFKPFVYAAALTRGFLPGDTFPDAPVEIRVDRRRVWRPANAGGGYSNTELTLTEGLAYSKNTITAQLMMEVGPAYVASLARDLGVRRSDLDPVPSLALGTSSVTLLEMVTAYATLANSGRYREPIPVTRVEDRSGRVLAEFGSPSERVLPEDVAHTVVQMMEGVIDRGTGRRIRGQFGITYDVAGKTGTTQDNADGWFVLMHPNLVVGARVGFPEPSVTFRSNYWGEGSHNALLVVGEFFRDAQRALPDTQFPTPPRYREPGSIFERVGRLVSDDTLAIPDYYSGYDFEEDTTYREFTTGTGLAGIEDELGEGEGAAEADDGDADGGEGLASDPDEEGGEEEASETEGLYEEESAVQRLYERAGEELPTSGRDGGD